MRGIAAAFVAMGVASGVAVAVGQYQGSGSDRTEAVSAPVPLPTARPTVVKVHVQPCESGWTLKRGTCVRIVEKVVTVPAAPAQPHRAPATRSAVPTRTASSSEDSRDDDADEVVNEDRGDDEPAEDSEEREQEHDD